MSIIDKIKAADDLHRETMHVPEWDVSIELRSMTGRQRQIWQNHVVDEDALPGDQNIWLTGHLLTSCCFDPETGDTVFKEADMEWLLTDKSFAVVDRIATKALKISAANKDAVDEAGKGFSDSPTSKE